MRRRDFLKGSLTATLSAVSVSGAARAADSDESGPEVSEEYRDSITPVELRCESMENPLAIDALRPRLSWKLESTNGARGQVQSAYRILSATTEKLLQAGKADLWDSGKVSSNQQLHIEYRGRTLKSAERCYWRVQAWNGDDLKSDFSQISWWEMGLLSASDWKGNWLDDGKKLPESDEDFYLEDPAPLFRKTFHVEKPVKSARLYAAGLGYYELRLNGGAISNHRLDPAWTSFEKKIYYTTHDVFPHLNEGSNVIGVMLGNGWYNPLPLRMWGRINIREHLPVGRPRFIAQLNIEYEDGTRQSISTDDSWKVSEGPVLRNSVYLGEVYDARQERSGWDRQGYDDSDWQEASAAIGGGSARSLRLLRAMPIPPIRATATLAPVSVTEVATGVFVFDLGQNFAGWARLRVEGPRGTTVRMRMGELIHADGTLNPMTAVAGQIKGLKNDGTPRGGPGAPDVAWQSNSYTLKGDGEEVYTPRFTFHGFRYVEVTGYPGTPALGAIEGLRLNTDVDSAGSFSCSNEMFNGIQRIVQWTFLSNLFSVQSDCPAREKFQYGGDIVASSEMAILNYDMASFYAKTVYDHGEAAQGDGWFTETAPFVGISADNYVKDAGPIGWGLAHPLLVSQLYQYYGDRRIVEEHFEAARAWVDLLSDHADGFIIDRCIGDHESLDPKPIALIATAHFFQGASLVARFARILGRTGEVVRYESLASSIRTAFVSRFLEPGTGRFDTGTQAAQATAIYMGLVPENDLPEATRRMVDEVLVTHGGHIATGIFGTKYLLNSLTESGNAEVAYNMVNKRDYPGWGHMLENGATTLWETWAASDNVYSQNHPMFGSVSEWMFKALGGITPEDEAEGFDRFRIEPNVTGDLTWVNARYDSVRGPVVSHWRLKDGVIHLDVEIPVNTTAIVQLPTGDMRSVREGGHPIAGDSSFRPLPDSASDFVRIEVGSGRYSFSATAP